MDWKIPKWLMIKKTLPSREEVIITSLVNKYLNQEVKKLISPISNEYFLINEINQIYICIGDEKIQISNHEFHYSKNFYLDFTSNLKKKIRTEIEKERQQLKKELFKNEIDLLQKINEL